MLDNSEIKYEAFDFHSECKKMRWDRLSILVNRVAHEQDNLKYFLLGSDGKLLISQKGVFRTNCVDCLDRTNVVQSLLGRRMLTTMLQVIFFNIIFKLNGTIHNFYFKKIILQ